MVQFDVFPAVELDFFPGALFPLSSRWLEVVESQDI